MRKRRPNHLPICCETTALVPYRKRVAKWKLEPRPGFVAESAAMRDGGRTHGEAPVSNDIAGILRRMQPRCQRYRGGLRDDPVPAQQRDAAGLRPSVCVSAAPTASATQTQQARQLVCWRSQLVRKSPAVSLAGGVGRGSSATRLQQFMDASTAATVTPHRPEIRGLCCQKRGPRSQPPQGWWRWSGRTGHGAELV